jgi:hypothetical protein
MNAFATTSATMSPDPAPEAGGPSAHRRARVTARRDDGCMILLDGRPVFARVALSCLVRPEPDDHVLALFAGELWIVCVLERESGAPLHLLTRGDAVIGAGTGTLDVHVGRLNVVASTAEWLVDELLYAGRAVTAHLSHLRSFARVIETLAGRIHLSAKSSHRAIEEGDHLTARVIDHSADSLHLQGDCAFINGGTAIRMDAAQIHMG